MQKDFMAMAQGNNKLTEEDLREATLSPEDLETLGMPSGEDEESMKQRFIQLFEEAGLMEMFQEPAQQQEFTRLLQELIESLMAQDLEAVLANPLYQLLEQNLQQGEADILAEEDEAPQAAAAPTNFAGMMPPGGGMGGR